MKAIEAQELTNPILLDGTQGESVSASADDKLKICRRLAEFGVDYIEAGWPGSNPKDAEFFRRAQTELPKTARAKLVAFGSTRRKNTSADQDAQVQLLIDSKAPTVCIVAKSHSWQVQEILKADLQENLDMIRDTVQHLTNAGRQVMVDMEHFFDGYAADPAYALQCCEAAADAGATCLVLCDTNGGTMPWTVGQVSQRVVRHFDRYVTIGIHCHNDCGMAVANSVSACQNGIGLIQGTINGIGERTGNADLCSIIPTLALHMGSNIACKKQLQNLTSVSRYVDEILNRSPNVAAPYVGISAFAHKGGLHVAAMERSPLSYQHIDPALVGNEMRVLISELSGRQNILSKMEAAGVDISETGTNDRALAILNRVKELEAVGYTFEGAEASVHLMILHATRGYCPPFRVLDYSAQVYDSNIDSATRVMKKHGISSSSLAPTARATIKVRTVSGSSDDDDCDTTNRPPFEDRLEVGDGNGPVDALAAALTRAVTPSHPYLKNIELVDYKVRILDPQSATQAATRVMIEFRDTQKDTKWTTVSVDTNVISASLNALVDGFEYALIEHSQSCPLYDDLD
jgi:2-isopropylmalate synthase